jgi:hypothetical protein
MLGNNDSSDTKCAFSALSITDIAIPSVYGLKTWSLKHYLLLDPLRNYKWYAYTKELLTQTSVKDRPTLTSEDGKQSF